jgi:hypothetical protein
LLILNLFCLFWFLKKFFLSVLYSVVHQYLKPSFFMPALKLFIIVIKYDRKSTILNSIKSQRKTRAARAFFDEPLSNTNLYKFSLISISMKITCIIRGENFQIYFRGNYIMSMSTAFDHYLFIIFKIKIVE